MDNATGEVFEVVPSGVPGLDEVLNGGLYAKRMYLLTGGPGTGKTTFALQFVQEGVRRKEHCLYIAVAGLGHELPALAAKNGFMLDPEYFLAYVVNIPDEILEGPEARVFYTADVGLSAVIKGIIAEIDRFQPSRVVIDSVSDLRLLAEDALAYQRHLLALQRKFNDCNCTVLLTNYGSNADLDLQLEALSYGVIRLVQQDREYGPVRRKLSVLKLRGSSYRTGWHDFTIVTGGITVFPALAAGEFPQEPSFTSVASGCPELDAQLGGGLTKGTSTIITGQSGTGKTTLANQYVAAAARAGERAAVYLFEETEELYNYRAEGVGLGLRSFIEQGLVALRKVNIGEMSPGEFIVQVRHEVEHNGATLIVIDTFNGFASAMPDEKHLATQLHDLLMYLSRKGVTTLIVVEQRGLTADPLISFDVSYLADTTVSLRFFEWQGEVRTAISVIKKRTGNHELTIRQFSISDSGISIGAPLKDMRGILTGVPTLG